MNIKWKPYAYLLIIAMLALQIIPVSAQGDAPDRLTTAQMNSAVVVKDGSASSRSNMKGEIYRFANCDGSDSDAPCYFIVTGSGIFVKGSNQFICNSTVIKCYTNMWSKCLQQLW